MDSFEQGGSEMQAVQLIRLLHESPRYDVRVACLASTGNLLPEVEKLGFREVPVFPLTSFYDWNYLTQTRRFVRYLKDHQITILQTHDFYTNIFGMVAARLAGVPVRIAARRETTGWRTPAQNKVEKLAFSLSSAIVANANAVREMLLAEGVQSEKVHTVYNGLNLERLIPKMNRQEALEYFKLPSLSGQRYVTIVANLRHPVKDHPTFLRAAQMVRDSVADARFIIAGEGELTEQTKALAKDLGIESEVYFIGRCEKVAELLALSEVCVLSSKAEGFSNSILEYMGASRAVVATRVGGASEVISDGSNGFLVSPGDPSSLADRIIQLLQNPSLSNQIGKAARETVEQKFSCQAQLKSVEKLYDSLLTRNRPPVQKVRSKSKEEYGVIEP